MTRSVPGATDHPSGETGDRASPAAIFAAELRELREHAGSPTFRKIARESHFSVSTVAAATSGRRLPTEQVVRAFAVACGADPEVWAVKLRRACDAQASGITAAAPAWPAEPRYRPGWVRHLVPGAAAVVLAIGMYAAGALTTSRPSASRSTASLSAAAGATRHSYPAPDGADPIVAACTGDARLIDKSPLLQNGVTIGALELEYSPLCHAGWARVYLYPAGVTAWNGALASVQVAAADGTASTFAARLSRQMPDYTDVIQPHGGCLLATAVLAPGTPRAVRASITCDTV